MSKNEKTSKEVASKAAKVLSDAYDLRKKIADYDSAWKDVFGENGAGKIINDNDACVITCDMWKCICNIMTDISTFVDNAKSVAASALTQAPDKE